MNQRIWRRARAIFEQALRKTPDEWNAFVERACGDDGDLRREVDDLLESHRAADRFLETPVAGAAATTPAELEDSPEVGRRIGPYRVVRRLAEGGMGDVYLAVRADDEFQRRVALKLLKPGLDSAEVLRRFRTERQILAALDHPNVAKLFDGGTTGGGRPYFVMDYVEGQPIDAYCHRQRLSVRRRIELFRTVCSAVSYAHRNLIVHRDLKPSNILVTAEGVPKLLDFGIAKLLNPELSSPAPAPTATVMRLMTPDYASPEQVRGEHVTTATDVYSLGVLLYQLLTGRLPHRLREKSAHEIVTEICDRTPAPPSVAVLEQRPDSLADGAVTPPDGSRRTLRRARRLRRRLSGDVDNIVLMALRKEPRRRYRSVEQLAEDLRRHLEGEPVVARKDTLAYRAGKFVRRHRFGVSILALLFTVVVAASVALGHQRRQVARERDRVAAERDLAERERRRAEQVTAFLVGLFEVADPLKTRDQGLDVRTVLDQGAERLATDLRQQPETRAALLETIGAIYQRLGVHDRAAELLESAVDLREQVHGGRHLKVADSLNLLAELRLARGDLDGTKEALERALAIRLELSGARGAAVAETLNDLGKTLHFGGELQAAEARYREALAMRIEALGERDVEVAETVNNLAAVLWQQGEYRAAEPLHRKALGLRRELLGNDHPDVSESLNNLATLLTDAGELGEARLLLEEALALRRRRLGADHPRVATTLHNLAGVLQLEGDLDHAERLNRRALDVYRRAHGDRHRYVAGSASQLATVLEARGRVAEAEALHLEAVAILRQTVGDAHPRLGRSLTHLAALRARRGAFADAEPLAREALEILERTLPPGHWRTAVARSVLGLCLSGLGRAESAEPLLIHGYEILSDTPSRRAAPYLLEARRYLAEHYRATGRSDEAAAYRLLAAGGRES